METKQDKSNLEGNLKSFLFALEDFLSVNSAFYTRDLKVVYAQEPQKTIDGYVARGLIEVGKHMFPFQVKYDVESDTIELRSKAFVYYISSSELQEFLEYERNEGDDE